MAFSEKSQDSSGQPIADPQSLLRRDGPHRAHVSGRGASIDSALRAGAPAPGNLVSLQGAPNDAARDAGNKRRASPCPSRRG